MAFWGLIIQARPQHCCCYFQKDQDTSLCSPARTITSTPDWQKGHYCSPEWWQYVLTGAWVSQLRFQRAVSLMALKKKGREFISWVTTQQQTFHPNDFSLRLSKGWLEDLNGEKLRLAQFSSEAIGYILLRMGINTTKPAWPRSHTFIQLQDFVDSMGLLKDGLMFDKKKRSRTTGNYWIY